jgi:hypothetical protein
MRTDLGTFCAVCGEMTAGSVDCEGLLIEMICPACFDDRNTAELDLGQIIRKKALKDTWERIKLVPDEPEGT